METYLQYELAPYPLSLFSSQNCLRKNEEFTTIDSPTLSNNVVHVVDGGFLLHKVIWQKNNTVEEIINKYVRYVRNNYKAQSHTIFDGYPEVRKTTLAAAVSKKNEQCHEKNGAHSQKNFRHYSKI